MNIIIKLWSALTNQKVKVYAIASAPPEIKVSESNDITYKDTTQFIVPITSGLVVKIYDGDTFTIASKLPYDASPLFRFSVHIRGLLSPDVRSVTPSVRETAKISKTALSNMIYGKVVQLTNIEVDQCGNLVANVSINGIDINEWMVSNDYSDDYDSKGSKCGTMHFRRINTY